jgi:hypothetical protein
MMQLGMELPLLLVLSRIGLRSGFAVQGVKIRCGVEHLIRLESGSGDGLPSLHTFKQQSRPEKLRGLNMVNIPKEADAAVKEGEGHNAKAPVKKVAVPQDLAPGQILVCRCGSELCSCLLIDQR